MKVHVIHTIAGRVPLWHASLSMDGSRRLRELMGKINAHAAKAGSARNAIEWTATADGLMAQLYALEAEARK
jgi:undecaprenyl pyrophosphate synthase